MIVIDYKPTPIQKELHNDLTRFKVAVFGRRSGKSTFAVNEAIKTCCKKDGSKAWIVAPTFSQAKDIYWHGNDMLRKYLPREVTTKINGSELLVEFINGSILQFKGADRPETMRGSALDLIIEDEVAEHRYGKETWEQVLQPSLTDKQGKAIFIGTPKGYNYFYDLYELGMSGNNFWKSWRVPTWESGAPWTLTPEGKAELELEKALMTEDAFMQEFGADFRKHTGLIFKDFNRSVHVKSFEVNTQYPMEIGQDFGFTNPTAAIFSYFDKDDNMYVFDEHYEIEKPVKVHAGLLLAKRAMYKNSLKATYGDSEDPQIIAEYGLHDWYISPVYKQKGSVISGINRIQEKLRINPITSMPKIFIHPRCVNLTKEMERYRWQEQKNIELNQPDEPEKSFDHAVDALRYIVLMHSKAENTKEESIPFTYRPRGGYS